MNTTILVTISDREAKILSDQKFFAQLDENGVTKSLIQIDLAFSDKVTHDEFKRFEVFMSLYERPTIPLIPGLAIKLIEICRTFNLKDPYLVYKNTADLQKMTWLSAEMHKTNRISINGVDF